MRIFVTGLEGQLARALAETGRHMPDLRLTCHGRPGFDLEQPQACEAAIHAEQPDVVVNTAAYTGVDKAESDPAQAFAINAEGAAAVARACARLDIPLIHLSTDYVFAGDKPAPYAETDQTGPIGIYGQSKLAGEIEVRRAAPRHLILRTSWVYSPFGTNFVKTMLRLGRERDSLKVIGDQRGCPTSAADLAEAVIAAARLLLERPGLAGTYHAAGTGETTWYGFAQEIFAAAAAAGGPSPRLIPITTADYPTPARRPPNSRLDCSKLRDAFGLRLPPWQGSVRTCVQRLLEPARMPIEATAGGLPVAP